MRTPAARKPTSTQPDLAEHEQRLSHDPADADPAGPVRPADATKSLTKNVAEDVSADPDLGPAGR